MGTGLWPPLELANGKRYAEPEVGDAIVSNQTGNDSIDLAQMSVILFDGCCCCDGYCCCCCWQKDSRDVDAKTIGRIRPDSQTGFDCPYSC